MTAKLFALAAAVATLAVSAPAFAKETVDYQGAYTQKSVEISAAGYNLDTPAGADRFHAVLDRAVRQVCDTKDRTLAARRAEQVCRAETMRSAVAQLDKPFLTAAAGGRIVLASN